MASVLCEAASAPTAEHTDEVGCGLLEGGGGACLALWVGDAAVPRTRDVRGTWRLEHRIHNHNVALSRMFFCAMEHTWSRRVCD